MPELSSASANCFGKSDAVNGKNPAHMGNAGRQSVDFLMVGECIGAGNFSTDAVDLLPSYAGGYRVSQTFESSLPPWAASSGVRASKKNVKMASGQSCISTRSREKVSCHTKSWGVITYTMK